MLHAVLADRTEHDARERAVPAAADHEKVRIRGLRVGSSSVDLSFRRIGDDVAVNVLGRTGNLEVVVVK